MHIEPKEISNYPWYLKPFFWNQRRKYGKVLKPGLLWARSPKVFAGVALLYGAIDRKSSPIDPVIRSLLTVRISQINWCAFCVDINSATMLKRGADQAKLDALDKWESSSLFSEKEKVALSYAESITLSNLNVTTEVMTRLKESYSDDEIVELTALIAFQNMSSKFNSALEVPAEGFCKIPKPLTRPRSE
ncbi:MAG: carboxymuconolactone decarboxylase family protein [Bdellovibrionales bacterium]|nr:carboxymuconolactone decarboxylase family protein [Bdellovibrionales bacterium]